MRHLLGLRLEAVPRRQPGSAREPAEQAAALLEGPERRPHGHLQSLRLGGLEAVRRVGVADVAFEAYVAVRIEMLPERSPALGAREACEVARGRFIVASVGFGGIEVLQVGE